MKVDSVHRIAVITHRTKLVEELQSGLDRYKRLSPAVIRVNAILPGGAICECDLLIIDVDDDMSRAVEAVRQYRKFHPCLPVVALVACGDVSPPVMSIRSSSVDSLDNPSNIDQLVSITAAIVNCRHLLRQRMYRDLTRTEVRILHLIVAGQTNAEIACQLHRSKRTVETHRRNIMRKLGTTGLVELIRHACSAGFSPLSGCVLSASASRSSGSSNSCSAPPSRPPAT